MRRRCVGRFTGSNQPNILQIEEKRKYLGGDSEHSVLVKGLDFALLEQTRARVALANDALDDESLEQVFKEVSAADKPKKKTREELMRELKEKRAGGAAASGSLEKSTSAEEEAQKLEQAKQAGKFKPIGFKPIGQSASEGKKKKKKAKDGEDGERKKKKRKLDAGAVEEKTPTPVEAPAPPKPAPLPQPTEEPIDDDFDIFADAGEYNGLELDDDDEADEDKSPRRSPSPEEGNIVPRQWIPVEDSGPILERKESQPPVDQHSSKGEAAPSRTPPRPEDIEMEEEYVPTQLVPLASSALPDIKELLEMDRAATSSWKNKKKKGKKKEAGEGDSAEPKISAEERAERDYKR